MPPKKSKGSAAAASASAMPILGRPTNNVSIGIVGLPNVGKSTFFNVMCSMTVLAENYPFCTIDPTDARVAVPDVRFDWLVDHFKPKSVVPGALTVCDIAGLVKGAAAGKGLGNEFLSHIAAVDAIFHVCRGFPGEKVSHVEGSVDPARDLEIIHRELQLKDIAGLRGYVVKHARNVGRNLGGKQAKAEFDVAVKALNWLVHGTFEGSATEWAAAKMDVTKKAAATVAEVTVEPEDAEREELGKDIRAAPWLTDEIDLVNKFQLLTAKPMVYLMNCSQKQYTAGKCKWIPEVKEYIKARGCGEKLVPFSASFEGTFAEMGDTEERKAWLETFGTGVTTAIPRIVKSGFKALRLVHYFTCGADEVKAWTVRAGSTAPRAAGVIHTDFEKGFICADVQKYDDLHALGSEAAVKASGKLRTEGKTYIVQDGDIMFFKTLPQVTFSVMVTANNKDSSKPNLRQAITSIAGEGVPGLNSARDFCQQLQDHPMAQEYDMGQFFMSCEQTFVRAIASERAVALATDPTFYASVSELNIHLSNNKVPLDRLQSSIVKEPAKTAILHKMMAAQTGTFCEVGFADGATSLMALQAMGGGQVFSFEGEEQEITIPAHDFIDAKYPDRLTLHLGDPSVLVPRFMTQFPDVRCAGLFIDGSVDDFTLRDAIEDFRHLASYGPQGHFFAIDVPSDEAYAASVAMAVEASEARGKLTVHTVVRGGMVGSLDALRDMSTAKYYANTLIVGTFVEPVIAQEVGATP